MKTIIRLTMCTVMSVIIMLMVMTTNGRMNRSIETDALDSAVESTVNQLKIKKTYTISNADEFVADLTEGIAAGIDSNGQISVKIMNEDIDTGLLSVRVEEKFIHPNGNTGKVTAERTVILADVPEDPVELCTVKFYISQGDSKVYKKCVVAKGDYLAAPVTPYQEGKQFVEWESVAGTDLSIPIDSDIEFYGVWE